MNAPLVIANDQPGLARLALCGFSLEPGHAGEAAWLDAQRQRQTLPLRDAWLHWRNAPPASDAALYQLALKHGLSRVEMVALALCCAAELDPMAARVLNGMQSPVAGTRPTLGLAVRAAMLLDDSDGCEPAAHLTSLHSGAARRLGLLEIDAEPGVLVERTLRTPASVALALAGFDAGWPELEMPLPSAVPLGAAIEQQLQSLARTLDGPVVLVLRCAWPQDGFAAAACLAAALEVSAVNLPPALPAGAGVWLALTRRIPVFSAEMAPGESRPMLPIPGFGGPVILVAGLDGAVHCLHAQVIQWTLPVPAADERSALWRTHGLAGAAADQLGQQLRLSAGRIQELAVAARHLSAQDSRSGVAASDVARAARTGAALQLGAQAQLLPDEVREEALVLPPLLRDDLDQLYMRCLRRDSLSDGLGLALRTRYRPGVRALFTGGSGTGKTLAVSWLATRLGLPLYRVDLSSVVSKYIGETEKNLAQLFARADNAEVVLLFDEADALFGKRTDIKDSNDRFANQQTNYLLQRIESFDGIAILTSNSRGRFDAAFTRRLDAVIEFTLPTPQERLALWQAHLGDGHALDLAELNRVAALCDLAGGHIRSCTLMAASLARPIAYAPLRKAILAEYAKLGRMPPSGL